MKIKIFLLSIAFSTSAFSADYKIDTEGMHASVLFKISHLGISWLRGGFDKFEGSFSYDADKPNDSKITLNVDTSSVNSNHAERDLHLKADGLLNTDKFPKASFISESFSWSDTSTGSVVGKFTLHGVEKTVAMAIKKTGEGEDPWGGYRVGFEGVMTIKLKDYGINENLGKASETLELIVAFEGVRQ